MGLAFTKAGGTNPVVVADSGGQISFPLDMDPEATWTARECFAPTNAGYLENPTLHGELVILPLHKSRLTGISQNC